MTRIFNFRLLEFSCNNCHSPAQDFTKIAVTDEVELYVEWFCTHFSCRQPRFCVVPMEHIAHMKPDPPDPEIGKPTTNELAMLHKAGIEW